MRPRKALNQALSRCCGTATAGRDRLVVQDLRNRTQIMVGARTLAETLKATFGVSAVAIPGSHKKTPRNLRLIETADRTQRTETKYDIHRNRHGITLTGL